MKIQEFVMLDMLVSNSIEARRYQLESDINNTINKTKDEYREMVGEEPPKTDYMQVEYKPKRYMVVSTILSMIFGSFGVDRKSTRLNSSHVSISYAVFCLKRKILLHYKFYM